MRFLPFYKLSKNFWRALHYLIWCCQWFDSCLFFSFAIVMTDLLWCWNYSNALRSVQWCLVNQKSINQKNIAIGKRFLWMHISFGNSLKPDQRAPRGVLWLCSVLFTILYITRNSCSKEEVSKLMWKKKSPQKVGFSKKEIP